jgi:hypothetical protein
VKNELKGETAMPKRGDKLYRVWNAKLEVAKFHAENIAEGASIPTWVVWDNHTRCRVSQSMYALTEKEAWEREMVHATKAMEQLPEYLQEAANHVKTVTEQFLTIKAAIDKLS